MIGKLTGLLAGTTPEGAVLIDVGGVGYTVRIPLLIKENLQGTIGPISLFIHTAVRDDAIDLYGFATHEELSFFKQLMSVSGIGPKTALNILNVSEIQSLKRTIARGDTRALIKIFGIGKKSAERVVVELRDKLGSTEEYTVDDTPVLEALLALGYRAEEVRGAVKQLLQDDSQPHTVSERVAAALKLLGSRHTL